MPTCSECRREFDYLLFSRICNECADEQLNEPEDDDDEEEE